jgi:DNA (cytosine-5)-methyltransferase 1
VRVTRLASAVNTMPVAVELCCGCGGMSTGFLDAGTKVAAGFDIDRRAVEAYRYNHEYRGSHGYVADIVGLPGAELLKLSGIDRLDVLLAGPPCQPFSIIGKRRGREDERARLTSEFVRFVGELLPTAFVFENVANLATISAGEIFHELCGALRPLGYGLGAGVVAAADYGVPQKRRRLLVIGIRGRVKVGLPPATHGAAPELAPHVTVEEAIGDLPDAAEYGQCDVHNHEPTRHTPDMIKRLSALPVGQRERSSFHDRLHPKRPAYTLRAGTGNFSPLRPIHYRHPRVITVRESARLQGFSDDFVWPDWIPRLQQYRQVGNAVSPPLAAAAARYIASELGWVLMPSVTKGDPSRRASAIVLTDDERRTRRESRIRGASLGMRRRA